MKTKHLLLIAAAMILTITANAQNYETVSPENDTITIGSNANYKVDFNITANAIYNQSGLSWTWGGTSYTLTQKDGSALTTGANGTYPNATTPDSYVDQNEVMFTPGALTGGTPLVLHAQEVSRPKAGVGCAGNIVDRNITVVALPTAAFIADSGACSLATGATDVLPVKIDFTGYGRYDINFRVQVYDLAGNPIAGANVDVPLYGILNIRTKGTQTAYIQVPTATFPSASMPAAGGYYGITMTDLQDRISQKTYNYSFGTATEVANATPAGNSYKFYIYPTPTTQPIQHVKNF